MGFKSFNIQRWLNKNRFYLWWTIYIPLVSGILLLNFKHLDLPVDQLSNFILSPQYKMFNSPLIIILGRIVIVALGAAILMICVLFPYFNVSKEGIQWTKEFQDELTEVSGEIAGEEIEGLVKEESIRWSLILRWLKMEEREVVEMSMLLRELLATCWEVFPSQKITLTLLSDQGKWGLSHPLLPNLIVTESKNFKELARVFGMKLHLGKDFHLFFHIDSQAEEFSPIDEKFLLVLGEIFVLIVMNQDCVIEELFSFFEKVPLPIQTMEV
jgi:hypothetical protein